MTAPASMVEKVARAIYVLIPTFQIVSRFTTDAAGTRETVRVDDTWEEASDRHEECRDLARAAIAAMLQPTDKMRNAGAIYQANGKSAVTNAQGTWDAMISAALQENET